VITSESIKQRAKDLGFDLCGIAPAGAFPELKFLREWIDRGYAGTMAYLPRTAERRTDVRNVMPSARSVVMTGTIYNVDKPYSTQQRDSEHAKIARYAWADDYHDVLSRRLRALAAWMRDEHGEPFETREYVDTGPVQERVYAQYAGLGWIGKNTCVINRDLGSWILLAEVICSLPLEPDEPSLDQCGTCTLCLDACPTGAFVGPRVLDSTRCISYLTIEYRGALSEDQRAAIGNHVFGCDICQEVCPWNAVAPVANARWPSRPELGDLRLSELGVRSDTELRELIEGTPITRAGVKGIRRNIARS
jgi:epoxyqueuosine reductase